MHHDAIVHILDQRCSWVAVEKRLSFARTIRSQQLQIFSILLAMCMPDRIMRFLQYGIRDADLPIIRISGDENMHILAARTLRDYGWSVRVCFQGWSSDDIRRFDLIQWAVVRRVRDGLPLSNTDFVEISFPEIMPIVDRQQDESYSPRQLPSLSQVVSSFGGSYGGTDLICARTCLRAVRTRRSHLEQRKSRALPLFYWGLL
jgi:hypothetical protein